MGPGLRLDRLLGVTYGCGAEEREEERGGATGIELPEDIYDAPLPLETLDIELDVILLTFDPRMMFCMEFMGVLLVT